MFLLVFNESVEHGFPLLIVSTGLFETTSLRARALGVSLFVGNHGRRRMQCRRLLAVATILMQYAN
jgi:hypothetical protein